MVGHRCQRRRLARPGWARAQDQSTRVVRHFGEDPGRRKLFEREHLGGDGAERDRGAALLVVGVDPKPGEVGNAEREVALEHLLVGLALGVAHDVVHHGVHVLVLHRRQVDAPDVAVDADHGRQPRRQMQVGSLVLDRESEELGNVHRRAL